MMRSSLSTREGSTKQTARLGIGGTAMIMVAAMAAAVATTMVQEASVPPAAGWIESARPAVSSRRIDSYLEASERANLEDALERASREPVGATVIWIDSRTHASGSVRPLRDVAGTVDASCRDYAITIDVPHRAVPQQSTNGGTAGNVAAGATSVPVSPAFVQFVARTCLSADGKVMPGARR